MPQQSPSPLQTHVCLPSSATALAYVLKVLLGQVASSEDGVEQGGLHHRLACTLLVDAQVHATVKLRIEQAFSAELVGLCQKPTPSLVELYEQAADLLTDRERAALLYQLLSLGALKTHAALTCDAPSPIARASAPSRPTKLRIIRGACVSERPARRRESRILGLSLASHSHAH